MLGYECPTELPEIVINPHLDVMARHTGGYPNNLIELRQWDGSPADQGSLIHELVHAIQWANGDAFLDTRKTEREALGVQCSWLVKIRAPEDAFPSEAIIKRLTA